MPCTHVRLGNGASAIVCTGRRRRRQCSTPGCRNDATLDCDWAVQRRQRREPRVGDARVHDEHRVIFYVVHVVGQRVKVSTRPDGGIMTMVTFDDWLGKTSPTCNRAVCPRCSVRDGRLDLCGAHGRMSKRGVA